MQTQQLNTYFGSFEGNRTPMQDSLGQFLNYTVQVPITPAMINENSSAAVAAADIYTDKNYNMLMNSADIIVNNNYDDAVNTQDIDIGFLEAINNTDDKKKDKRKRKGIGAAVKNLNIKKKVLSSSESSSSSSSDSSSDEEDNAKTTTKEPVVEQEDVVRTILKPKPRGRYVKKMCVSSALKPVHIEKQMDVDPATETLFKNIISNNQIDKNVNTTDNNRMFASHMLDKTHYMFLVTKSTNPDEPYSIRFINCVYSVYNEYTAHHMHHDRFILVVTYDRFRFLISYNLLLSMNVEIPLQDRFDERKLNDNNKNLCFFEEVKDFEFLSLLTNLFQLDKVFIQGKFSLLLASIGENRAMTVFKQISETVANKSIFTTPFYITKKEANPEELVKKYDKSLYVEDIMKLSKGLKFKQLSTMENFTKKQIVAEIVESLMKFYTARPMRGDHKDKNNSFTYKYGCVARQFYDGNDKNVTKLFKIKKENGSTKLIENYLDACKELLDSHSFILISTKTDERITIVKMNLEFFWITSVLKDIVVTDIVEKFGMYNHYIFNLNNGNRKEVNNRHNGMIKLLSYYTGKLINLEELNNIATSKFLCNFHSVLYNKMKSSPN